MGLLDGLLGQVVGSLAGGNAGAPNQQQQSTDLATNLLKMMAGPQIGGLGGLLKNFEQAGVGHLMKGWISTGPNPTPTPQDVQNGLGQANLQALSAKSGMSVAALLPLLTQLLPVLIDKMTPDGNIPAAAAQAPAQSADPLAALLGGLLGKR